MTPPATSAEKAHVLNAIERTKKEFTELAKTRDDPPLGYWLDTMEALAMLGFEYGRKEMAREWQKEQEKLEFRQ